VNSGIAVFETGRIFGGDSIMAYLGSYEANGGGASGTVKIWGYNPHQVGVTAFGTIATPEGVTLTFEATRNDDGTLTGYFAPQGDPSQRIEAQLVKVAELPG